MTTRLNSAAIRARRLELGLSERKLAALIELSQSVVRGIESGITHKDLTLGELDRVADALSLSVTDLLAADPGAGPGPALGPVTRGEHFDDHVSAVGALLHDVQRLIPVESLAVTVGLTLDETHEVLEELTARLRPVGLCVHRLGNSVKLGRVNDAVPRDLLERTWRAQLARRGLDAGQARLLHQAVEGRRTKHLTNDQLVTVAELANAGLLVRTTSGGAELSDDVRYSLLLDDPQRSLYRGRPQTL